MRASGLLILIAFFFFSSNMILAAPQSKLRLLLSSLPEAQWPAVIPGEGIITIPEETIRRLEAKYGLSPIDLAAELGRLPIPLLEVERLSRHQFRLVWDNHPNPWANRYLDELWLGAMRQSLAHFGQLRPVSVAIGDQLPSVGDPLAEQQFHHELLQTVRFQSELARRSNRQRPTMIFIDSGIETKDPRRDVTKTLDPRSKSFLPDVDPDDREPWQDKGRHGTTLAEIASGVWNNGLGGHGVARCESIWVIKAFYGQQNERGQWRVIGSEADIIRALEYLRTELRPTERAVVNISWSLLAAYIGFEEVFESLSDRVMFFTSGGNLFQDGSPSPMYPCVIEKINNFCGASLERNGITFRGKFGPEVDGAFVGVGIVTTFGPGSGSSYVVPQYTATAYELMAEDNRLRPQDIASAFRKGPLVQDPQNLWRITKLDPLGALIEIRRQYPLPPPPRAPMVTLVAEPNPVELGQMTTLRWSTTDASRVEINPLIGRVEPNGTHLVSIPETTIFTITARGEGGLATVSLTITVKPPKPTPAPPPPTNPTPPPPRSRQKH